MVTQVASLIVCLFLTQIVADTDVQFVMDRNPNNYFCGHLQCVSAITDSDNEVASFVDMTIYDITRVNSELKVAYVSIFQPDLYVDTTKSSALSCTGVISRHQANLTVPLRHDIDCLYGVFKCQLRFVTVSGHSDEVTEIVIPEHNHSFSRISDVSTRVDRLAVLLDDQLVRVNTQTAEIKRLADIVDSKIVFLIEHTAQACNSSERPDLNRTEHKLPNDTREEVEKHEVKPESVENLSNRTDDKIPGGMKDGISATPTDHSVNTTCYPGWSQYGDSCYSFSQRKITWTEASTTCTSYGSRLAEIASKDINDWVANEMKARKISDAWINSKRRTLDIQTLERVSTGTEYTNWREGEPDSRNGDCDVIVAYFDYKWIKTDCNVKLWFICQERAKA